MPAKVTVIVVNWNGEKFLDRCLTALLAQTVPPHEIILVDNASSDASRTIYSRFRSVLLLEHKENLGFARANNLAISTMSAQSEWVALLNPDAFPEPQWLEALLVAAERNPGVDFFGSKLVTSADAAVLDGAGDAYHVSGLAWRTGHGALVSSWPDQVSEIFSPCAAAAIYRRGALLDVGGFDNDYFCYFEDVDLGFRLRLAGYRCLYVPSSVVHHVGSGTTGGKDSDFAVYHGHRNLVWTYVKDMPGALFWFFLPLHLAMNLAALTVFILRGQGSVMIRAKRDAVLGLPRMWAKRREIQKNRRASWRAVLRVMTKVLR